MGTCRVDWRTAGVTRGVAVDRQGRCLSPRLRGCFQSPLIEPDMQIARIRLSDQTHAFARGTSRLEQSSAQDRVHNTRTSRRSDPLGCVMPCACTVTIGATASPCSSPVPDMHPRPYLPGSSSPSHGAPAMRKSGPQGSVAGHGPQPAVYEQGRGCLTAVTQQAHLSGIGIVRSRHTAVFALQQPRRGQGSTSSYTRLKSRPSLSASAFTEDAGSRCTS
jgi:hypothetical protein